MGTMIPTPNKMQNGRELGVGGRKKEESPSKQPLFGIAHGQNGFRFLGWTYCVWERYNVY